MASEIISGGVGAELKDPRRLELIEKLDRARGGNADCAQEVWAALWLCSVEKLEEYVKQIEMSPSSLAATSLYTKVVLTDIIKPWLTSGTKKSYASSGPGTPVGGAASPASPSTPTTTSSTTPNPRKRLRLDTTVSSPAADSPRSAAAKDLSLERDGEICVITKMGICAESAHIYPYSLRERAGRKCERFWTALSMFWPQSTIDEWKADVFGGTNTELCANRITLSPDAHAYWDKGLFAFKPVSMSEDKKTLKLEFHWLWPVPRSSTMVLSNPPTLEESLDRSNKEVCLFDATTDLRIKSGHEIIMKTDDPLRRPLPSIKLLKLQWALQRLASLSGAAEAIDELLDSDDEGDHDMVRLYESQEDFCEIDDVF
ncbi:hypothetical protein Aspvir_009992 [Aspergillus viridinutans]|uniref:HNH nuclease domain-containing protein n=1 Tax=Aspergillus viridinutans TaxID=75553 RepID=A0A9P3F8W5_ASPVI|nr:uncharacterized protein Aspvir_009992 [Aspergillus viridinutans]GIK05878.1 hypothetical protein Aspvir_009992 [Aspergillus viridinutans]